MLKTSDLKKSKALIRKLHRVFDENPSENRGGSFGASIISADLGEIIGRKLLMPKSLVSEIEGLSFGQRISLSIGPEKLLSFWYGLPGILWVAKLAGLPLDELSKQVGGLDSLFLILNKELNRRNWNYQFDLGNGLVGVGLCALTWKENPQALKLARSVLIQLKKNSKNTTKGRKFFGASDGFGKLVKNRQNVGMAHGLPGVIALLAFFYEQGVEKELTLDLLKSSIRWLLEIERILDGKSFPCSFRIDPNAEQSSRMSWCHGDPGVALALLHAACATENRTWKKHSIRIMKRAAGLTFDRTGVRDTSLCHGTSGMALMFYRFYQKSKEREFKEAARFWYRQTISLCENGDGPGGTISGIPGEKNDYSLLNGAAGVFLALKIANSKAPQNWDSFLLMSSPRL